MPLEIEVIRRENWDPINHFVAVPTQNVHFQQHISWSFCIQRAQLRWDMTVWFVDIRGINDNHCLNLLLMMHINIYFTNICSRRYWSLYQWYIKPPPVYGILTHYPCYIELLANCFFTPLPPLPIVYQIPINGIMTPCTLGISKDLPMVYRHPLPMICWPHYPSYDKPLPMLYQTICLWYYDPTHGILTS